MSVIQITKILEIEELRESYSRTKDKHKFLKLYRKDTPRLKNRNSSDLWEEELLNQSSIDEMTKDRINIIANEILRLIKHQNNKTIFDLGIGSGLVEKKIISKDPSIKITGLDFTKRNLKELSKVIKNFYPINASFQDFLHINKLKKYDLVLALEVMEHIDPDKTFSVYKKLKAILKPNGSFILSVPVNENLYEKIISNTNYSAHVRRYTEKLIKYELELAGFEIINEIKLYAFHNNYKVKSVISKLTGIKKPNVMIFTCRKK